MRRIPWRYRRDSTNGLLENDVATIRKRCWNRVAVNPPRFLRKPLHKAGAIIDFIARFGHRAADLERYDAGKVFAITPDFIEPAIEECAALLSAGGLPSLKGLRRYTA